MEGIRTRLLERTLKTAIIVSLVIAVVGCSTQSVDDPSLASGDEAAAAASDFSALDQATALNDQAPAQGGQQAPEELSLDNAIEQEIAQGTDGTSAPTDDFAAFDQQQAPPAAGGDAFSEFDNQAATPPAIDPGAELNLEELPPPAEPPMPVAETLPPAGEVLVTIKSLQFRANDSGGTVVIEADGPMQFSTRANPTNQQFVIEIPNSKLPKKLRRPLNTKDFGGAVGSVDAYPAEAGGATRVVLQLRSGDQEPTVQSEGNSLLVVTNPGASSGPTLAQPGDNFAPTDLPPVAAVPSPELLPPESPPVSASAESTGGSKLLTSDSLAEFIANNQTFYGRKISIETDEVEIRDVIKMISEEANVNLILAEEVRGKVSIKLKNVPWDQALVLLMKTKKLGYTRNGNVLRISSLAEIKAEEKDYLELQAQRRSTAVPKVRTVQVNYAKVDEIEKQIKGMLSKTGAISVDARTSSIIISDLEENIDRAVKVIKAIDVPPQQVLIEGKIVEVKEDSESNLGIQWSMRGAPFAVGTGTGATNLDLAPELPSTRTFNFDMRLGTFDILGDLSATLAIFEKDQKAKILSSPRIVAVNNERASIEQTLEVPIRSSTVSNGAVNNTVSFKPVSLVLEVTPQITNDGAVIMAVRMQREFLGAIADATSGAREQNRRQAQTKVIVRNGQTAVIGGIYQNDTSEGESRVPGLGRIPVIGWLFRGQTSFDAKNELLIFLTPRVLGQLDSQVIPSQNIESSLPPQAPGLEGELEL